MPGQEIALSYRYFCKCVEISSGRCALIMCYLTSRVMVTQPATHKYLTRQLRKQNDDTTQQNTNTTIQTTQNNSTTIIIQKTKNNTTATPLTPPLATPYVRNGHTTPFSDTLRGYSTGSAQTHFPRGVALIDSTSAKARGGLVKAKIKPSGLV